MDFEQTKKCIEVMQAYVDGKTIEYRNRNRTDDGWFKNKDPSWLFYEFDYRVIVEPDYIDWSHVAPEYKWMARDAAGIVFLYEYRPLRTEGGYWYTSSGKYTRAHMFASYKQGTVNWKDSLVERPN